MKNIKKYLLRIYEKGKKEPIYSFHTKSKRRLNNKIEDYKWKDGLKAYIRVSYGKFFDCCNEKVAFCNEGFRNNEKDTRELFDYFDEMQPADFAS